MRTPEEWDRAWRNDSDAVCRKPLDFISAIQSDASRSAARSERERAARVCEDEALRRSTEMIGKWHTGDYESGCRASAALVRSLPDDNALGAVAYAEMEGKLAVAQAERDRMRAACERLAKRM